MILFPLNLSEEEKLNAPVSPFRRGDYEISRHANREIFLRVHTPVHDAECFILGTIAPPEENLMHLLLLAHTLKKEGAKKVTALLPYLSYTRQDKQKNGEGIASELMGGLIASAGIDSIVTIDIHSDAARNLFRVPLISISSAELFAETLKKERLLDATLVAPDERAVARCQAVASAAGIARPVAYFKKERTSLGVEHFGPIGAIGESAVLIDDMLDTGGTLIGACKRLSAKGVKTISVMVTHGLFTGERWKRLWEFGVRRIYCTDSIRTKPTDARIVSLPVFSLLTSGIGLPSKQASDSLDNMIYYNA
ncbi:ribose-phosphate pyrophosphokinase [Candidatus Uhrbacteria bacterium]|nr:ribose-phosphate pyrophosphokinase [Candidatus Uhrbacteria bacterium]